MVGLFAFLRDVNIERVVWHLNVGSSHSGAGAGLQGFGCSPIKVVRELGCLILCFGVVRQFGPYLSWAQAPDLKMGI